MIQYLNTFAQLDPNISHDLELKMMLMMAGVCTKSTISPTFPTGAFYLDPPWFPRSGTWLVWLANVSHLILVGSETGQTNIYIYISIYRGQTTLEPNAEPYDNPQRIIYQPSCINCITMYIYIIIKNNNIYTIIFITIYK